MVCIAAIVPYKIGSAERDLLYYNSMQNIPFFESYDPQSKKLTLRGASYLPQEVFAYADDIEILDASEGTMISLPDELPQLHKMRVAFFSQHAFATVPEVLGACLSLEVLGLKSCNISTVSANALPSGLRWLILTDNRITELPPSIGSLKQLQKVALAGNQLHALPEEMAACTQIEFLRIAANNFESIPSWVLQLPKLAWYGDSNVNMVAASQQALPKISWNDVERGELIGQSPSSQVFAGVLKKTQQPVAIKIYKNGIVSDGFPADDMRASIAAAGHPQVTRVIAILENEALIMERIPSEYTQLGLPPTLDSITRDSFTPGQQRDATHLKNVLADVARAGAHLHSRGIMHGDLYAHNILTNADGHSILGDFGAASLYDPSADTTRELIDVRAFGYLVDDLLRHHSSDDQLLTQLRDACLAQSLNMRPLFTEIVSRFAV